MVCLFLEVLLVCHVLVCLLGCMQLHVYFKKDQFKV